MIADPRIAKMALELRQNGITNPAVLQVMEKTPRDLFVPKAFHEQAYENTALPIGQHQTISQPLVVAQMTQALQVGERMKVLEIGTGSGYQTSILSPLCRRVYTIERHRPLFDEAAKRFKELRLMNVVTLYGDGSKGWPGQAPFDRIIVTAAAIDVPPVLVQQLAIGGIMVVPIGDETREQRLVKVVRTQDGSDIEDLGPVRFVPLVEGTPPSRG